MSSIIKKRRGGSTYLLVATSVRVEGRPRIVEQVYLGTEEGVIARLTATPGGDPGLPVAEHRRFGDVAAVWGMLARLDAIAVIDSVVFGLDTHALILDLTNFATFIDSGNDPGADRGAGQGQAETL